MCMALPCTSASMQPTAGTSIWRWVLERRQRLESAAVRLFVSMEIVWLMTVSNHSTLSQHMQQLVLGK